MTAPALACVIPAYDAEVTIAAVIAGLRAALARATIIVVDDGSRDRTGAVARAEADVVMHQRRNFGKGRALRAGFAAALAAGHDAILTIDADGQHDPRHAPALLSALARADVVIGSRAAPRHRMPLHRRLSNAVSSAAVSACAGTWLRDSQSGYRVLRGEVLRAVHAVGDRYEFETDFLIRAARAGFRVAQVPVPTIYGAPSHFQPIGDALRVARSIWRHRAGAFR